MDSEPKECLWCDRTWAILGMGVAVCIVYVSVDLLLQGKLTALWGNRMIREETTDDISDTTGE